MNGILKMSALVLTFAVCGGACVTAAATDSGGAMRELDTYLRGQVEQGFSGAVLVARRGSVLLAKGYGYADAEWKIPNTVQTRFRIASLTKSITATAVMRLRERGKLDLQDSICKYLDTCPEAWNAVTLHHLLSNSSGIPNHFWGTEPDRQAAATREQVLARMSDKPLEFAPGTRFNYGNASWYLLGIVIEKITGRPYDQALQDLIFEPLGMKDTGQDDREQIVARRAAGYVYDAGHLQNAHYEDVSWVIAAASLYSTVEDIYKFDRALDSNALLSAGGRTLMWTSLGLASDNGKSQYGYGWWILPKGGAIERTAIRGTGGMAGFMSQLSRYPDEGVTIIVLENTIGGPNVQPEIEKRVFDAGN